MAKKTIIWSAVLTMVILTASIVIYFNGNPNFRFDIQETLTKYSNYENNSHFENVLNGTKIIEKNISTPILSNHTLINGTDVFEIIGYENKTINETINTYKQIYVKNESWNLAAVEYVYLYDGTTKMRASSRNLTWYNDSENVYAVRTSKWKDNITTIQTYKFRIDENKIENIPTENKFECLNCKGKFVQFEIRNILYEGETQNIQSPFRFGNNMELEWEENDDFSFAKVYQQKTDDKIIVKFKANENYEEYFVRLSDPTWWNSSYLYKEQINVSEEQGLSLQNFGVNITMDTESLVSAGKLQADCDDMRFVNSTENGIFKWRNLTSCNTSTTVFQVEMNITRSTNNTLYAYYGESGATNPNYDTGMFYDNGNHAVSTNVFNFTFDSTLIPTIIFKNYGTQNTTFDAQGYNNAGTHGIFQHLSNVNGYEVLSNTSTNITIRGYYRISWTGGASPIMANITEIWEFASWRPYVKVTMNGALADTQGDFNKGFRWATGSNAINYTNSTGLVKSTTADQNSGSGPFAEGAEVMSKHNSTNVWVDYRGGNYTGLMSKATFPNDDTYDAWARGTAWYAGGYGTGIHVNNQVGTFSLTYYISSGNSSGNIDNFFSINENPTIYFGSEESNAVIPVLNSPENEYNSTSSSVTLNCSAVHVLGLSNVSAIFDSVYNQTNSSGINNTDYIFNITGITEGKHNWTCGACSSTGQCGNATARNLSVDTIYPNISYNPTSESDNSYLNRDYALVNVSANDTNKDTVNLIWDGVNETFSDNAGNDYWENKTSLSEGEHTFQSWVNDSAGHYNFTSQRTITIDLTNPQIAFVIPSINNSVQNENYKNIILDVNETNPKNVTYTLSNLTSLVNQTTYLMSTDTSNISINFTNLPETTYLVNATTYDLANNVNSTSTFYFTITTFGIFFNNISGNNTAELGSNLSFIGNSTANISLCVDINHPNFGTNYSCGYGLDFDFVIDYFRNILFSNGNEYQTLTFDTVNTTTNETEFDVNNFSIPVHQYDYVENLSVNISGNVDAGNSTISEPSIIIYKANNASDIDRAFYGELIGNNIYVEKVFDNSNGTDLYLNSTNVSFDNYGDQLLYMYVDRNADIISFLLNLTGFEYGASIEKGNYTDDYLGFSDFNFVDVALTTAQLDISGVIMAKNISKAQYVYDNFDDGTLNQSLWLNSTYIDTGVADYSKVYESGGKMQIGVAAADYYSALQADVYTADISMFDFDTLNLTYTESTELTPSASENPIHTTEVDFGDTPIFYYSEQAQGTTTTTTISSNLNLSINKYNSSYWYVDTYGTFNISRPVGFDDINYVYTGNRTYFIPSKTTNPYSVFHTKSRVSGNGAGNGYGQSAITIDNFNYTLSSRNSSMLITNSLFDSSADITSAVCYVTGQTPSDYGTNENLTLFLSSDDGSNWENTLCDGNETIFSNPGRNIKFRADFNLTQPDNYNSTIKLFHFNITTDQGNASNVSLDFGNDGTFDYTMTGELNSTNSPLVANLTSSDLSGAFTGSASVGQTWLVPLRIFSATRGIVMIDGINLTYNPNPVYLNTTSFSDRLKNVSNYSNLNISIGAVNGTLNITNLRYDYAGGNKTYFFTIHDALYTLNLTGQLTYYFSQWDYEFVPSAVDYILFMPKTPTSKNVTPYGQTTSTPILNITNLGYGGKNTNLSVKINSSLACVNTTISNNGTKFALENIRPSSISTVTGTLTNGNLTSVLTQGDGDMYNVSEIAGIPGYDVRFNFTNASSNNNYYNLSLNMIYFGPTTSTHQVNVQLQNNSGSWITLGEFSNTPNYIYFNFVVNNSSNYVNGSTIRARIYHDENGNINHKLSIDKIKLDYQETLTLSEDWQLLQEDVDYLQTTNVWLFADYSCSYSNWTLFNPYIYFRQCCEDCLCSEEIV